MELFRNFENCAKACIVVTQRLNKGMGVMWTRHEEVDICCCIIANYDLNHRHSTKSIFTYKMFIK